ncbi:MULTISPECIES: class I SAM-dependent methyltransferase [unclassified Mesorhizobium]|uniref:O-methyltransferase n=1 Tax=unclassified Mesorhizobium TaxID=325217 RepID=UPI00112CCB40|nr:MULTISPECIES: class I SAM-dependent methyltransferase [unclassified Mesorhizobium]MBZ9920097.1 class I SAM-dependent methyltransferase [Mesorhizobium sp. BR1-1-7]MBZ9955093.1 class I SAM-dependent methyltransferase [Mesorhizobium sp. BR1-1-15]MBZ9971709.1 class I SAM-dependent methyltransferase [Mesorhizobium sp. BR1-1-12]TPK68234.1 class I SAM-dependent methyltransferase [Mesorhizobium sp. B2-5-1]TPM45389.1 class I SAM-dependent methyltransferase [Mesorhizobium sp. B2-2-3]
MRDFVGAARRLAFNRLSAAIDRRWNVDPLGSAPRASKKEYLRLFEATRRVSFAEIDRLEAETGFAVDRDWLDELALHTQITIKTSALAYPHGRVLYSLLRRQLADSPRPFTTVVETGTARGFSAICMAKALADAGACGHVVTLDVLPHHHRFYWNCIDDHDGRKSRAELLRPWQPLADRIIFLQGDSLLQLPRVGVNRIHFAFIDAQHTRKNVLAEHRCVSGVQREGDMVVFDDVTPGSFDGVVEAVAEIERQGRYEVRRLNASKQRTYAWGIRR